jgi:hypothetical protein
VFGSILKTVSFRFVKINLNEQQASQKDCLTNRHYQPSTYLALASRGCTGVVPQGWAEGRGLQGLTPHARAS